VGEGQVADAAHGDAVGKGRGVPAGIDESRQRALRRRVGGGLDADDLDAG
jgi:hypothetical protein